MTSNHIGQLAQWYESAEQITKTNLPRAGDTLIFPYNAGGYAIEVEEDGWTPDDVVAGESVRILARAPKPEPAWHDAVAVTATATDELGDEITAVWVREGDELWRSDEGGMVLRDDLRDVTPLIEAKVTDEMTLRYLNHSWDAAETELHAFEEVEVRTARNALTAALGLETA